MQLIANPRLMVNLIILAAFIVPIFYNVMCQQEARCIHSVMCLYAYKRSEPIPKPLCQLGDVFSSKCQIRRKANVVTRLCAGTISTGARGLPQTVILGGYMSSLQTTGCFIQTLSSPSTCVTTLYSLMLCCTTQEQVMNNRRPILGLGVIDPIQLCPQAAATDFHTRHKGLSHSSQGLVLPAAIVGSAAIMLSSTVSDASATSST